MRPLATAPPRHLLRSFDALAEAVLPAAPGVGPGATHAAAALERHWPILQPRARLSLAGMLAAVEVAAVAQTRRSLSALPLERRTALCDELERHGWIAVRSAFLGAKTLILILAAADPEVESSLGTDTWPPNLVRSA